MLKEIENRQSIRRYLDKPVEEEKILEVLKAAMNAPTAMNKQSWRFLVITNREVLNGITEIQKYAQMMKTAPCAILVSGDRTATPYEEFLFNDASAAVENMLIEAVHQGLGTCWCAVAPLKDSVEGFKNRFNLPESYLPIAIVALGYSDENRPLIDRFDENKITYCR